MSGTVLVTGAGSTLNANTPGIVNLAGGSITNQLGGAINDDLNNAGTVLNDTGSIWTATVASNRRPTASKSLEANAFNLPSRSPDQPNVKIDQYK